MARDPKAATTEAEREPLVASDPVVLAEPQPGFDPEIARKARAMARAWSDALAPADTRTPATRERGPRR